jgi:hypothetical protein
MKNNINNDLNNLTGTTQINSCFCATSAYRYLIVISGGNQSLYYNPVNLSEDYKDKNYNIVFSADLLNDSSIVYTNLANDALVEAFKVRNIKLTKIQKSDN